MTPPRGIGSLHERLDRFEHLVTETCMHPAERIHLRVGVPAWKLRDSYLTRSETEEVTGSGDPAKSLSRVSHG
jgi:hypothetical protein